jgi:hypothetical protein
MLQQVTSMFLVRFPAGLSPVQVDDFPPKTPRSCKGALHIAPSSTKKITTHEAEHLTKKGIPFTKIKKLAPKPPASEASTAAAPPESASKFTSKPAVRRSKDKEDAPKSE